MLVDGRAAKAGVELVEVIVAEGQLVGKDVGQRDDLRGGVFGEGGGDGGAAIAAAEQAEAHGGVGLIAEGGAGLEEQQAAGGSGLDKFATVHAVTSRSTRSRKSLFLADICDLLRAGGFALDGDGVLCSRDDGVW